MGIPPIWGERNQSLPRPQGREGFFYEFGPLFTDKLACCEDGQTQRIQRAKRAAMVLRAPWMVGKCSAVPPWGRGRKKPVPAGGKAPAHAACPPIYALKAGCWGRERG